MLLLGLLPMATTRFNIHVNAYQLPFGSVMRFVLAPLTIVAIWAFDRFMRDFARYTKFVLTAAAAVQVISLCLLLFPAGTRLTEEMLAFYSNAHSVSQSLGLGAWLMLGLSAVYLIDCGLQLTKGKAKTAVKSEAAPTAV